MSSAHIVIAMMYLPYSYLSKIIDDDDDGGGGNGDGDDDGDGDGDDDDDDDTTYHFLLVVCSNLLYRFWDIQRRIITCR